MERLVPATRIATCGVAVAVGLWVLTACGESGERFVSAPVVADSAGVRVVTYDRVPPPTAGTPSEPLFSHGHGTDDYTFQRISAGALDTRGRAVVYDAGSGDLIRIGPDGALDSVLARRGRGPSEVLQLRGVHAMESGAVLAEDMSNAKWMMLEDGAPPRSISTVTVPELSRGLMIVGRADDGAFLMVTSSYNSRFEEPWFRGRMVRVDLDEMRPDTVAAFDMASRRSEGGPESPWSAFGRATAAGSFFVSARSDMPELTWHRPDGSVHQILRWHPDLRYPTAADWASFEEGFIQDMRRVNPTMPQADAMRFAQEQLERFELRTDEPYPLFGDLRGDDEGRVWMGVFDHRGAFAAAATYEIIGADGTWLGRVEFPDGFRVLDIRDGRALGVVKDEMEVEAIAVLELNLAREAGA